MQYGKECMYSMIYSFPLYIAGTTGSVGMLECGMPIIDSQLHIFILHADFMHLHLLIELLLMLVSCVLQGTTDI